MKLRIKKDDEVQVISGSEKGKKGHVLDIQYKPLKIKVSNVFIQSYFDKKERKAIQKESFIAYSNVKLIKSAAKKTKKRKPKKK